MSCCLLAVSTTHTSLHMPWFHHTANETQRSISVNITEIPVEGYEKVLQCDDSDSKLRAIISIHDTTLGPALGGMRM